MAILVGFHTEGWDHLILRAYLAKLLDISETDIEPDWIEAQGRGWKFVLEMLPKALKRFYGKCAQAAVIGIDNDGNVDLDLQGAGAGEDPGHPRHWLHPDVELGECRWCQLAGLANNVRPELTWLPKKSGRQWPIIIALPVEMIEAWLIICRALVYQRPNEVRAEMRRRDVLKREFYGKPAATRRDVENVALPIVRSLTAEHLRSLEQHSRSFAQFARQVQQECERILGHRDCWADGDRTAPSGE